MTAAANPFNTVPGAEEIRVLIADDHVTVREGLAAIIGRQPDMQVIAEAANGREALEMWQANLPDIVLLDLRMPIMDGVAALNAIRGLDSAARVIVLTTFDTDNDIALAIKGGAKGYLLKDAQRSELLDCIRRVHAGETCIPPALLAKLITSLGTAALSGRELDVLTRVAHGDSNKEIALRLYVSEATVKSHLRSIFGKLKVISRTEAISVATQRGLIRS
ncbi:response regulator transcription factor [Pseudolysobacter antarcticus]|uniref:Response regulator transcription factor n=1 Tax=Pseudolysobacter antarcticus TaxID=2511995 RepID=A0A411HIT4_9GAMM|nr:response regulator transcription factor [Pseudolysobacter antarcticus]QBB70436.1 response regulator transcription factor [Pseudolysobacter antarcticus]